MLSSHTAQFSGHTDAQCEHTASHWYNRPALLLLVTGTLIGLNFPLAKQAGEAGIPPLVWVLLVSIGSLIGSGLMVYARAHSSDHSSPIWPCSFPTGQTLRYALIAGPCTFAAPNLLVFSVLPHTGAGYAGLMFALSPVVTLLFSALSGMKTTSRTGLIGITLGLAGATIVSLARINGAEPPPMLWIVLAFAIPVVLAFGNIYRTRDWPDNAQPDLLAFWSHVFATLVYLLIVLIMLTTDIEWLTLLLDHPIVTTLQLAIAALTAPFLFRLQQHGGPVMLSQIGYVAAAVSLMAATLVLGETYHLMIWVGAGIIAIGIGVTVVSGKNKQPAVLPRNQAQP